VTFSIDKTGVSVFALC